MAAGARGVTPENVCNPPAGVDEAAGELASLVGGTYASFDII